MTQTEHPGRFVTVQMVPTAWQVTCPCCEAEIEIEATQEDFAGQYHPAPEARYIHCECGQLLEADNGPSYYAPGTADGSQ